MTGRLDVIGVGNALVDLQVQVDDAFVGGLPVEKGHMSLVDDHVQVGVLASLDGHPVHRSSGGSAANTVVGVATLGGKAAYCGSVARDELGDFYVEDLRRSGVEPACPKRAGRTGTCAVFITPDAQRTMLTHLGASADLGPEDVDVEAVARARWLYVEGYLLPAERTRAAAMKAIEAAKSAGVKVALTVSDPFVVSVAHEALWDLIRGPVDLLFCNELEAQALTGLDSPVECARRLHRENAHVALTLGARGSLLMHDDELHPIEGVPVEAVDTTGAGDMYAAGVLHGLTHGLDWPTAGHLASHAAARVVSRLGARLPRAFTPEEMAALCERR